MHLVAIAVGAEITGETVVVPPVSRRVRGADYMTPHVFVETDRPRTYVVHLSGFTAEDMPVLQNALSIFPGPTPVTIVGSAKEKPSATVPLTS